MQSSHLKDKVLNLLLIVTSLFAYLEWGGGNSAFLFQAEYEVFNKLLTSPSDVVHPFSLVPMLGQVLLLITLFQKSPWKSLTFAGMGCIGVLLVFIFFIGIVAPNFKMLASTLPFLGVSILAIINKWHK